MMPVPPRMILFDWDNTLVDTWRIIHHALVATFEGLGEVPWTLEQTRERVRSSAREAFPRLFGDRARKAEAIFYATYERDHLAELRPLPHVDTMLQVLHAQGQDLAVLSNKKGELLRREVAHLDWGRYFGCVTGAGDAVRDKPAIEAVEAALTASGMAAGKEVWLVGDTDIDMKCAIDSGCTAILLRAEPPGKEEFAETPPAHHVQNCRSLLGLLAAVRNSTYKEI